MPALIQEVYSMAMKLPEKDRRALVEDLIASLGDDEPAESQAEIDAAWDKEIDRRVAEIESGKAQGMDAFEDLKAIRARHK
ncbi:MAG TPA: addiction module protein [Planctomycetota bacterium]|nr:addiction module protein [Planctomycetota bacterium]